MQDGTRVNCMLPLGVKSKESQEAFRPCAMLALRAKVNFDEFSYSFKRFTSLIKAI